MKSLCPLAAGLCIALAAAGAPLAFGGDADLERGVRFVEEGDYDAAILTLDGVARRLAADPARVQELSQAYLYLGVAYVAKGHEAAAKAKFREAVSRIKDLTLSPDKFPPKVIDIFEAARAEEAAAVPGPAPKKKGGGAKKPILIVGAGGAALAAGLLLGGGSPPPPPPLETKTEVFASNLNAGATFDSRVAGPAGAAGSWTAQLTWSNAAAVAILEVWDINGNQIMRASGAGRPEAVAAFVGQAGASYRFDFYFDEGASPDPGRGELRVTYPR